MNDSEDKIVAQAMQMLSEIGFLHLKNVPEFDEQDLFEAVKEFHAMPQSVLHKLKPNHYVQENKNIYRGWFPFLDNDIAHKEFFDMGCPDKSFYCEKQRKFPLVEETPFPTEAKYRSITKKYKEYWHK